MVSNPRHREKVVAFSDKPADIMDSFMKICHSEENPLIKSGPGVWAGRDEYAKPLQRGTGTIVVLGTFSAPSS